MSTILVVDDETKITKLLAERISREGMDVLTAASAEEALPHIEAGRIDVVLCDLRLGGMDGLELLKRTKSASPGTDFVMMTAYASAGTAIEAMRQGAYEYLIKPFQMDEVVLLLKRIHERRDLMSENAALREKVTGAARGGRIVGDSASIRAIKDLIGKVAPADAPVLVQGESGSGKELVAAEIHGRAGGPASRSSFSTARRSPRRFSNRRCSDTNGAPSPAPRREARPVQACRRRHPLHGRDRRNAARHPGRSSCVRSSSENSLRSAASKSVKVERANRRRDEPQPRGARPRGLGSARISSTGSTCFRSTYRRSATGRTTSFRDRGPSPESLGRRARGSSGRSSEDGRRRSSEGYSWPGNVRELKNVLERAVILAGEGTDRPRAHHDHEPRAREGLRAPSGRDPFSGRCRCPRSSECSIELALRGVGRKQEQGRRASRDHAEDPLRQARHGSGCSKDAEHDLRGMNRLTRFGPGRSVPPGSSSRWAVPM